MVDLVKDETVTEKVTVLCGAADPVEVDMVQGLTVGTLREALVDQLNIDPDMKPFIGGDRIGDNFEVVAGDTVEFVKEGGRKQ
jgi:hypothetical protein